MDIKKDSWHYRLAYIYGSSQRDRDWFDHEASNICSYTRKVVWGAIKALIFACAIALFFSMIVDSFMYIYFMIVGPFFDVHVLGIFPLVFVAFATFSVTLIILGNLVKAGLYKLSSKNTPKKPSFVIEAYKAFKGKYCSKLNFVDNNSEK